MWGFECGSLEKYLEQKYLLLKQIEISKKDF